MRPAREQAVRRPGAAVSWPVASRAAGRSSLLPSSSVSFAVPAASAKNTATLDSFEIGCSSEAEPDPRRSWSRSAEVEHAPDDGLDAHSVEMAYDGYFDHSSRDGTPFWKRVDQWYGSSGYRFWSVGENILWSSPNLTPGRAIALWMASPEHRANILNPQWREIGVAAVHLNGAARRLPRAAGDGHHDRLRRASLTPSSSSTGEDRGRSRPGRRSGRIVPQLAPDDGRGLVRPDVGVAPERREVDRERRHRIVCGRLVHARDQWLL